MRALAELLDERPVGEPGRPRIEPGAGGGLHERHELVGEAGHRAGHADPADVRTPADAVHPSPDRHVAADDRAAAAELHQAAAVAVALRRTRPGPRTRRGCSPRARCGRRSRRAGPASSSSIGGATRASWSTRRRSVCVMLSGCTGQPGRFTTGMPSRDVQLAAQVVAEAHGAGRVVLASRGSRRMRRTCRSRAPQRPWASAGRSSCRSGSAARSRGRRPYRPSARRRWQPSLGTEPSSTRMNGSSLPSSASYHARMKSSPVSKANTGL